MDGIPDKELADGWDLSGIPNPGILGLFLVSWVSNPGCGNRV